MDSVSIILPAHNEAPRIFGNLARVCDTTRGLMQREWKSLVSSFEVIVVDDGSTDGTWLEIQRAMKELPEVQGARLDHNVGKGLALRRGFQCSHGSWVFFIDSDLDIAPAHMADLSAVLVRDNVDAVLGSKLSHDNKTRYPLHRRVVSLGYSLFVRALIPLPVRDTQTGFKLFRRAVLEQGMPRMLVRQFAFDIELISIAHRLGFKMKQCPVEVAFTDKKRGSVTLRNIYNVWLDTLAVYYRLRVLKYYDSWQPKDYNYRPRVSVVVAVKGDNPYLRQCVERTLAQSYPDFELIVLPDEPMAGYDARVRIMPTGPVLPAIKRNRGARAATGELIAFLDDDAYPVGSWMEELVADFADERVAAVGGPGETPPEDTYWQQVSGAVYSSFATSGAYRYRYIVDRRREVDDYPTCNLSVRRSVFENAKGFQTNYWPGEDTELCLTITKKLGGVIIYDPLVVVHHHRRSLWKGHFKQVTQYALHRGYFVKKFPETSRRLSYFMPTLFTLGVALGWVTWWLRPLFWVYCGVIALYLLFVLAGSFLAAPHLLFSTVLGTVLTHCAYGVCFLKGLLSRRLAEHEEQAPE